MFGTKDHNMKMFSKIETFLQNQFIKKLIYDFISQLIFKHFQQIKGYLKAIPIVYNTVCTINISLYSKKNKL